MTDSTNTGAKEYEIQQVDGSGTVLASHTVEAASGEAAVKQLKDVVDGTKRILVCRDGIAANELEVSFWKKRVQRR